MEKSKKKTGLFILILSLCVVVSVAIGITIAVLLQNLEKRANNFTFGNLSIDLTEPGWDTLTEEERLTYPGRSFVKDPRIKNTGETEAYLYMEVKIPRDKIQTVNADQTINDAKDMDLFSFTAKEGWTKIGEGVVSEDGKFTSYVYAYTASAINPGESTPTLFDSVEFVNALEGQPEMNTKLDIPISAIGIQSGYLNETGDTLSEKIINAYAISLTQKA